jgi:hypothetical protein
LRKAAGARGEVLWSRAGVAADLLRVLLGAGISPAAVTRPFSSRRGFEQQLSDSQSMLAAVPHADVTPEFLELEHRGREVTVRSPGRA